MTSLTEVYDHGVGAVASRRRRWLGRTLFGVGGLLVVAGIVLATTGVGEQFGLGVYEARELAGVMAGLGIPASLLGIFSVLPATRRSQATAVVGSSIAVLGVVLFRDAYPYQWVGASGATDLTLPVVVVYVVGVLTTFWCLFLAVATIKRRNDPGGTVRMEVTETGSRVLEVTDSVPGFSGVGFFGTEPTGNVDTQTNQSSDVAYTRDQGSDGVRAASDGGATTGPTEVGSPVEPDAEEVVEAAQTRGQPDAYCGNCEHFEYVRVDGQIKPGCTFHNEVMDDMESCEDWSANN